MIYRGLAPQPQWRRTSSRAQHFIVCRASFFFFFFFIISRHDLVLLWYVHSEDQVC